MTLVIDASVAAQWFLNEPGSDGARRIVGTGRLVAPDFILAECFHAVWKRWRRGEANSGQLQAVVHRLHGLFDELTALATLVEEASDLAVERSHPLYDCLYLVLARRAAAPLVTNDERQLELARRLGIDVRRP